METFCHSLSKPSGSLLVSIADRYLDLTVVLKDRAFSAGVSLDAYPEAKQLLEPCDRVELITQRNKVTILANGEDVIRNVVVDTTEFHAALTQITESFSELSRKHAETISKSRNAKDVKDEALLCLQKIEDQHREDFTKFILILNEKKKKIRELQRRLGIRTDDPEDIEDDIDVHVSADGASQPKKARASDQLALEGPSGSTSKPTSEGEDDGDNHDEEAEGAEDVDQDELQSDDGQSDRVETEVEEIDEDDAPTPPRLLSAGGGKEVLEADPGAREEDMEEGIAPSDDGKESEDEHPSPRRHAERFSKNKKDSPKKTSLDLLDDLL